ncbi:MAG: AAA family ATPase [Chthoniobacter sp.]|nr:AAA family ATPase [Chthoniobacter sp.]
MPTPLERITIEGFKSIRQLKEFNLRSLNVLIGANGAGKSNLVDFFRILRAMSDEGLASFVHEGGGADGFFFNGPKLTPEIKAEMAFGENEYRFVLTATRNNEVNIKEEDTYWTEGNSGWWEHGGGRSESLLKSWRGRLSSKGPWLSIEGHIAKAVSGWVVYHFHDTSSTARMRREHSVRDFRELRPDAGNVAAFLYRMKGGGGSSLPDPSGSTTLGEQCYNRIRQTVQLIAPFFDDFLLEPETKGDNEVIRLEWRQKGSGFPFQPWQLSDGTIRFICLATALLQPAPPATIVIDEPELGLHPFALELLASLVKEISSKTQLIISTQSPAFLTAFEPEDVVVVDRVDGASRFRRLDTESLKGWLDDFTLGELVQKNVIEAGPVEQRAEVASNG